MHRTLLTDRRFWFAGGILLVQVEFILGNLECTRLAISTFINKSYQGFLKIFVAKHCMRDFNIAACGVVNFLKFLKYYLDRAGSMSKLIKSHPPFN